MATEPSDFLKNAIRAKDPTFRRTVQPPVDHPEFVNIAVRPVSDNPDWNLLSAVIDDASGRSIYHSGLDIDAIIDPVDVSPQAANARDAFYDEKYRHENGLPCIDEQE